MDTLSEGGTFFGTVTLAKNIFPAIRIFLTSRILLCAVNLYNILKAVNRTDLRKMKRNGQLANVLMFSWHGHPLL